MLKSYQDVGGFGKESIDAVVATNVILMKGLQELNTQFFGITTFLGGRDKTTKLFTCKPWKNFSLFAALVKANYDDVLVGSKMSISRLRSPMISSPASASR